MMQDFRTKNIINCGILYYKNVLLIRKNYLNP